MRIGCRESDPVVLEVVRQSSEVEIDGLRQRLDTVNAAAVGGLSILAKLCRQKKAVIPKKIIQLFCVLMLQQCDF